MVVKIFRYGLIVLGLALVIFLLWYFNSIVVYIIISAILGLVGHPLVRALDKVKIGRFKIPRSVSAGITLLCFYVIIFTFFRLFIPLIAFEANEFSNIDVENVKLQLQEPINQLQGYFGSIEIGDNEAVSLEDYISQKVISIVSISQLSNLVGSVTGILGDVFIAFFAISFITFFFLRDEKMAGNGLLLLIPSKYEEGVAKALTSIKKLLLRYFLGLFAEVLLVMILITFGLWIVGIDFQQAVIIGLFAGMLNVVPYVGPVIGTLFGLILGLVVNLDMNFYSELLPLLGYMLIVFVSVQVIDNVLFQPLIYSNSVNAHPLEIFLVILIAGSFAGIKGMIVAIPMYTVLRVIAKEFFNKFKVVKKLTENI